jgi:ribosomal protein S18 acetylase RimI-like enzyme
VDPADLVRLTARCYEGLPESQCFAPDGRLDQWAHYLGQLLATPACGIYLPAASFAIERRASRQLVAAVVTTAVAPATAHVAQIVVDNSCRREGLAQHLLGLVAGEARATGHARLSLIVSERNVPARTLYARLGFDEAESFIFARRAALSRRSVQRTVSGLDTDVAELRVAP